MYKSPERQASHYSMTGYVIPLWGYIALVVGLPPPPPHPNPCHSQTPVDQLVCTTNNMHTLMREMVSYMYTCDYFR